MQDTALMAPVVYTAATKLPLAPPSPKPGLPFRRVSSLCLVSGQAALLGLERPSPTDPPDDHRIRTLFSPPFPDGETEAQLEAPSLGHPAGRGRARIPTQQGN